MLKLLAGPGNSLCQVNLQNAQWGKLFGHVAPNVSHPLDVLLLNCSHLWN